MAEINFAALDNFKVRCRSCKCAFEVNLNRVTNNARLYECPVCGKPLGLSQHDNNVYMAVKDLIRAVKATDNADFILEVSNGD